MAEKRIGALFASDIRRRIEEVIKVDQADDEVLRDEIQEYVVTDAIRRHYVEVLDRYSETPNKPHEGIAVWVSGFKQATIGCGYCSRPSPRRSRPTQ